MDYNNHSNLEKVKSFFRTNPKVIVGGVIILALSLPFVINQVLKQQDVRQRADSAPAISINLSPPVSPRATGPLVVGDVFDIQILVSTQANEDIGAIHFVLDYDQDKLSHPSVIAQSTGLQIIQNPTTPLGKYEATMVNINAEPKVTGINQAIVTLRFTAKTAGDAQVSLDPDIKVTAATYNTYVPVNNSTNINSTYTIALNTNTTPTSSLSLTPAVSPTVTPQEYCATHPGSSVCLALTPSPTPFCKTGANTVSVSEPCGTGLNRHVNYICYDGTSGSSGDLTSCKTFEQWKTIADSACTNHGNNGNCQNGSPTPTQAVAVSSTPTPTLLPTSTPIPTPVISSGETALKFSLSMPGIGHLFIADNTSPRRTTRIATTIVYDSENIAITTPKTGVLIYNATTGRYDGKISLGDSISTQSAGYIVKVKMDNTLYKRTPGIVTITKSSQDNIVAAAELVPGDITGPYNTLDILDYNLLGACYRGEAACSPTIAVLADFNDDGIVKGDDIDDNIQARGFYTRNGD